ncbi:hypothetical protein [Edaphocola flava]|uniref:hypothetical protein n=1 Tax=Edaphocola flava TaxID=2499629 RepID=UPI00100C0AF9|nr:hypothetical protein [Edaphocola flava]
MKKVILSAAVFCIAGLGTAMAQENNQNVNQTQEPPRTDTVTAPTPPPAGTSAIDVQTTPATPVPATSADTPKDKADRKSRDKKGSAPKGQ